MIDSVCICLTFKCNLACRHCFVEAGPNRVEEMSSDEIYTAIDNSFDKVNRMYFSGGEPTIVMDKLLDAVRYVSGKRKIYGYPREICIQTNGCFAKTPHEIVETLKRFAEAGATDIDITSNDSFHFEQMDSNLPQLVAKCAAGMGVFNSVMLGGSEYKVVKRLGRAKEIAEDELKDFDLSYIHKCVLTKSDYVIHPDGSVLPCIYGFSNCLGNIFSEKLDQMLVNEPNASILNKMRSNLMQFLDCEIGEQEDICNKCNERVRQARKLYNK